MTKGTQSYIIKRCQPVLIFRKCLTSLIFDSRRKSYTEYYRGSTVLSRRKVTRSIKMFIF